LLPLSSVLRSKGEETACAISTKCHSYGKSILGFPCRHDYCGVKEDLENYWPKLKRGGIIAGHDYL
jgi:hypothetical protein